MAVIGKIKFAKVKNNRGAKTDFFRVVYDVKDPSGDWKEMRGCEELTEMNFYFPFEKMENNIKIVYSGYTQLPKSSRRNASLGSYFVVSEGIGSPLIATPDGHDGRYYDGRDSSIELTEERFAQWTMVKKRMTVFLTPADCAPNEYVVWHTTSEIAMDSLIEEYSKLVELFKTNLSLVPLTFKAIGKQGKTITGVSYRFFYGTIGSNLGLSGLRDGVEKAKELRDFFDVKTLENNFEKNGFFYDDENNVSTSNIPEGYEERVNTDSGEVTTVNQETDEILETSDKVDYGSVLAPFCAKNQAIRILSLAVEQDKEEEILKITSTAQALSLLNSLQNSNNDSNK